MSEMQTFPYSLLSAETIKLIVSHCVFDTEKRNEEEIQSPSIFFKTDLELGDLLLNIFDFSMRNGNAVQIYICHVLFI